MSGCPVSFRQKRRELVELRHLEDLDSVLKRADAALYDAKQGGMLQRASVDLSNPGTLAATR